MGTNSCNIMRRRDMGGQRVRRPGHEFYGGPHFILTQPVAPSQVISSRGTIRNLEYSKCEAHSIHCQLIGYTPSCGLFTS